MSASILALHLGNVEGRFWGIWRGTFGEYEGAFILRAFARKKNYLEKFLSGFRDMKNDL